MGDTPLYEVCIKLKSKAPHLLMVASRKGTLKHISGEMAALLGTAANTGAAAGDALLAGLEAPQAGDAAAAAAGGAGQGSGPGGAWRLQDFLPSPWKYLHANMMKVSGVVGVV